MPVCEINDILTHNGTNVHTLGLIVSALLTAPLGNSSLTLRPTLQVYSPPIGVTVIVSNVMGLATMYKASMCRVTNVAHPFYKRHSHSNQDVHRPILI
jgi:hypothetical protein